MKLIIAIIVTLLVGVGLGYSLGNNNSDTRAVDKELQDSITMMKEQAASIQKMAEMMMSSGAEMQNMGLKYKDDSAVSQGKDLEAIGKKYLKENAEASESNEAMKDIMGE